MQPRTIALSVASLAILAAHKLVQLWFGWL